MTKHRQTTVDSTTTTIFFWQTAVLFRATLGQVTTLHHAIKTEYHARGVQINYTVFKALLSLLLKWCKSLSSRTVSNNFEYGNQTWKQALGANGFLNRTYQKNENTFVSSCWKALFPTETK